MTTTTSPDNPIGPATAKLVACVIVLVCLAVGAAGLILPLIHGLLFLAIAALVAAKYSPAIERLVRSNRTMSGYLDMADGFMGLPLGKKIQFGCLLCLKMLIDAVAFAVVMVTKLVNGVLSKGPA
jgi:uncharacterized membrane protein YbaN (DUF454 family)